MTKEQFMERLLSKAGEFIESVDLTNSYKTDMYKVQLKEGVDRGQFVDSLFDFIQNNETSDRFDIVVNGFGEDFASQTTYPVNGLYGSESNNFEVNVDGTIYTVLGDDIEYFTILLNGEFYAKIYPEIDEETLSNVWLTDNLVPIETVQKIGLEIDRYYLQ